MSRGLRTAAKYVFAATDRLTPRLQGPRLLIYHQVGVGLGREMEVTEEDFVAQLDALAANWPVASIGTALNSAEAHSVLTFDDGFRDLYEVAYPHLKERGLPFVLYLTTGPVETGEPLSHPGAPPLSWDQVLDMLGSGLMTLGSHTHTHPDLRVLQPTEIEAELVKSDELIIERTGLLPRHFAYPYGYWSPIADQLVRTRYQTAAVGAPLKSEPRPDVHRLPRLPIQRSDGMRFFRSRMTWGLRAEERVRRLVRGYRAR